MTFILINTMYVIAAVITALYAIKANINRASYNIHNVD